MLKGLFLTGKRHVGEQFICEGLIPTAANQLPLIAWESRCDTQRTLQVADNPGLALHGGRGGNSHAGDSMARLRTGKP